MSEYDKWSDRELIYKTLETYYPCPSNRCLCSGCEPELNKIVSALLARMQPTNETGLWREINPQNEIVQRDDLIITEHGSYTGIELVGILYKDLTTYNAGTLEKVFRPIPPLPVEKVEEEWEDVELGEGDIIQKGDVFHWL